MWKITVFSSDIDIDKIAAELAKAEAVLKKAERLRLEVVVAAKKNVPTTTSFSVPALWNYRVLSMLCGCLLERWRLPLILGLMQCRLSLFVFLLRRLLCTCTF